MRFNRDTFLEDHDRLRPVSFTQANEQHAECAGVPVLSNPNTDPCTVAIWFRMTSTTADGLLFAISDTDGPRNIRNIQVRSNNSLRVQEGSPSTIASADISSAVTDGQWHLAIGYWTGSGRGIAIDGGGFTTNSTSVTLSGVDTCFIATGDFGGGFKIWADVSIAMVGLWDEQFNAQSSADLFASKAHFKDFRTSTRKALWVADWQNPRQIREAEGREWLNMSYVTTTGTPAASPYTPPIRFSDFSQEYRRFKAPAVAGRIMSSLVASGGLAGPGGIAGPGGGLAA
ncbi:MAG: LamG-like jellyroll fold domain-containing protein [Gammaproteobacteria bacterium]